MKCKICGSCTYPPIIDYRDAYEIHRLYRCPMDCKGGSPVVIENLPEPPRREIKEEHKGRQLPQKDKQKILTLTAKGLKYDEIAEATGYSKPTIWRVRGVLFMAAVLSSKYFKGGLNVTV